MAECSLEALRLWEAANAANTDTTSGAGVVGEGSEGQKEVLDELSRMRTALYGVWGRTATRKAVRPVDQDWWSKFAETWENQVLAYGGYGMCVCIQCA